MHISSRSPNRYQTNFEDMVSGFNQNEKLRKANNPVISSNTKKSQDFYRMMTDPSMLENDSSTYKDLTAFAPKGRMGLKLKALELQHDRIQNTDNVTSFHNNKHQDVFEGESSRSQWQRFCG